MQKTMIAMGLVLGTLLTGCGAEVLTAEKPVRERTIGKSTSGQQRQVLPMDKVQKGTYLGKDDPARHGLTKLKPASGPVGGAQAESGAEAAEPQVEGPGHLALVTGPDDMKIAPVLGDDGVIERLIFSPAAGSLDWNVRASGAGVVVKAVKLTLQVRDLYPVDETAAATGAPVEAGDAEPVTVELETAKLGWPTALRSGSEAKLALSLKTDSIRDFLKVNGRASKLAVKVELLDPAGFPVVDEQGQPLELASVVQVL